MKLSERVLAACGGGDLLGDGPPGTCAEAADTAHSLLIAANSAGSLGRVSVTIARPAHWAGFAATVAAKVTGAELRGVEVVPDEHLEYVDTGSVEIDVVLALPPPPVDGTLTLAASLLSDGSACPVRPRLAFHGDGASLSLF